MLIFKFGGASVKDASAVINVGKIIEAHAANPSLIVVISAMGKTTRELELLAKLAWNKQSTNEMLKSIVDYHRKIISDLHIGDPSKFEQMASELTSLITDIRFTRFEAFNDAVMAFGELFSTTVVANYLESRMRLQWVDARSYIITDDLYGEANIHWVETTKRLTTSAFENKITVTQGFIGQTINGDTTTIGKEGSDYTAAIFANLLNASSVTVWKDVPGIMNADPKKMKTSQVYDVLSYQEIAEMTYYGAQVIHPRTLTPLAQKNIPLFVKSFHDPINPGTEINSEQQARVTVPTFIHLDRQTLVTLRPRDNSFIDESALMFIFKVLNDQHIKINLMQNSALTFSFCFKGENHKTERLIEQLSADFVFTYNEDLQLVTIKNYDNTSIALLPDFTTELIVQKTRSVFQRLYN